MSMRFANAIGFVKDWTGKDKDKDQAYDPNKDKD